jgi:para-aminobenzoate synthetase/4-amino-4-deoxychorismate lyase
VNFRAISYDGDSGRWRLFGDCQRLLIARTVDEITSLLAEVEAVSRQGQFAVGYVAYEADPRSQGGTAATTELPLAAFGVFQDFEDYSLVESDAVQLALQPIISRDDYGRALQSIRAYLQAGDTYQVNFTHPLVGSYEGEPEAIFARLARAQATSYATLIEMDAVSICCVSPELFFERENNRLVMEPMKGTRKRDLTLAADRAVQAELEQSEKDQAENLMIVDMVRNDLGRLATTGSVQTDRLFHVRKLPTVWQMVSNVSAVTEATLPEIFAALFPCASVTGAPKTRTMQIIHELEQRPRGVYTGAVGTVKPGGDCVFSVAIRTLVLNRDRLEASYGVGGGIVWDSDDEAEWQESLIKGEVLQRQQPAFELLETLKFEPDEGIVLLEEHLTRLAASAEYFDYPLDLTAARQLLGSFQSQEPQRLRLLLSSNGHLELQHFALKPLPPQLTLRVAAVPVDAGDVFLYHKTTHRQVYESALAGASDCDDVILWNERGELTETSIFNLFLEIDGELLTPPVSSGLLAGTFRESMLRAGKARERVLMKTDLELAVAIYVGNSVRGLIPARIVSAE